MHHFEQRFFATRDGMRLGYQVAGNPDGRHVLCCNGLGGNCHAYQPLVDLLGDRYYFVVWDYRGLFTSTPPRRGLGPRHLDASLLGVEAHARDGAEFIAHLKLDRFPIISWSMGVQVALELYRTMGERITGLVLLNGIAGNILATMFGGVPRATTLFPPLVRLIRDLWPLAQLVVGSSTRMPALLDLAAKVGVVHPSVDRAVAGKVVRAFGGLDMHLYFELIDALAHHDASDMLPRIACPTLVTAGDRDVFTPGFATRRMASALRNCELYNYPQGSHYAPIEFATEINANIARFLDGKVTWPEGRSAASA